MPKSPLCSLRGKSKHSMGLRMACKRMTCTRMRTGVPVDCDRAHPLPDRLPGHRRALAQFTSLDPVRLVLTTCALPSHLAAAAF
jgi:hypothetical protein